MANPSHGSARENANPAPASDPVPLSYRSRDSVHRWVRLGNYEGMQAELVRLRLEQEGILCSLGNQHASQAAWGMGNVRVDVPDDQLEVAQAILKRPASINKDDLDEDEGYVDEPWRCPKCHSKNVGLFPLNTWELLLALATVWLATVFMKRKKACRDCQHVWKS